MSSVRGSRTSETIYEVEIEWDGTRGTPFCQACDCPEGPETCDVSPSGGFLGKETRIGAPEQRLDADKHATVPSSSDVRIPRGRAKHGFYNTVQRTTPEFSLRTTFIVLMSEEGPRELKEAPKCTLMVVLGAHFRGSLTLFAKLMTVRQKKKKKTTTFDAPTTPAHSERNSYSKYTKVGTSALMHELRQKHSEETVRCAFILRIKRAYNRGNWPRFELGAAVLVKSLGTKFRRDRSLCILDAERMRLFSREWDTI
ncbi:hypothetical protein FB451DRAFT_1492063 [Mycena latifolia]|nr:hypothetical protein FB451DRAFT_1492063 [Mycena latifolia]